MADIVIKNYANAGGTSANTDLTGINFDDDPVINNYVRRDSFPNNNDDTAVPFGLQANYSLNFDGINQYVEGDLDPNNESIIAGSNYTFTAWVKIKDWGTFTTPGDYQNLINTRDTGAAFEDIDDTGSATPGFNIGITININNSSYYWVANINGEDVQEDDDVSNLAPISLDTWYYICLVKEGAGARFYVSEEAFQPVEIVTLAGLTTLPVVERIRIGRGLDAGAHYWEMQMVNAQIWSNNLSEGDLEAYQYAIQVPPAAEPSGLLYYYRMSPEFNETLRDRNYNQSDGFFKDFSGNPSVVDSPTDWGNASLRSWQFDGTTNYAITYDNSNNAANNQIDRQGTFYDFLSSYTIECWVKFSDLPTNTGDPMGILSKWDDDAVPADERGWRLSVIDDSGTDKIRFEAMGGTGNDDVDYLFEPTTPVSINKWYWIVVVKDAAAVYPTAPAGEKRYHFFLHEDNSSNPGNTDVVDDSSSAFTTIGTEVYQPEVNMLTGAMHDISAATPTYFLNGKLFVIRVYKGVRTSSELIAYRNSALNL